MLRTAVFLLDLLRQETAWLKNGLFFLLFVYFGVHSSAMRYTPAAYFVSAQTCEIQTVSNEILTFAALLQYA
jgi:hypothetical protein